MAHTLAGSSSRIPAIEEEDLEEVVVIDPEQEEEIASRRSLTKRKRVPYVSIVHQRPRPFSEDCNEMNWPEF